MCLNWQPQDSWSFGPWLLSKPRHFRHIPSRHLSSGRVCLSYNYTNPASSDLRLPTFSPRCALLLVRKVYRFIRACNQAFTGSVASFSSHLGDVILNFVSLIFNHFNEMGQLGLITTWHFKGDESKGVSSKWNIRISKVLNGTMILWSGCSMHSRCRESKKMLDPSTNHRNSRFSCLLTSRFLLHLRVF